MTTPPPSAATGATTATVGEEERAELRAREHEHPKVDEAVAQGPVVPVVAPAVSVGGATTRDRDAEREQGHSE